LKKEITEFGSQKALEILRANEITSLQAAFDCGDVIHKRYDAKSVSYVELDHQNEKIGIYIKKQWRQSRLIPRMHSFLCGKAFTSYPLQEWRGLNSLRAIGLYAAEPLALFRHRWHPYKAAVVTLAVPAETNLTQMIRNGGLEHLEDSARSSLIHTLVSIIQGIHNAGFGWRSLDIKHFFPVQQSDGSWQIWLIDCEGIFSPVKKHHIERERRSFLKTIDQAGNKWASTEKFTEQVKNGLFG